MNRTRIVTVAAAALVMASLGACSQGATIAGQASVDAETVAARQVEEGQQARAAAPPAVASVIASRQPQLGGIVTDGTGRTLYRFDKDTARPSKSNCDGDCATAWPPVLTQGEDVRVQGVDQSLVGTVVRSDGSRQVTIAGWPLYTFSKDTGPGDINGQGAGGNWFVSTPQGKKATGEPTAVVSLSVMEVAGLGDIVTDREGMTLYRFDNDTARPSKSNCDGDCATAWPPVLTESEDVRVQGVDQSLVGTVVRADGSRQVTIAGWPVYRFAKDQVPCDTTGQGVGGVWFVITPQGQKAGV